jgi:uncharacterized protein (TIGR01777 family)
LLVAITGSSGLVGRRLATVLHDAGIDVLRIVRRPARSGAGEAEWDPAGQKIETAKLDGADAVVHLAGENIAAGRWNRARKRAIVESRVDGTRFLSETLAGLDDPPRTLICASAIGYYGDRGDEPLRESSNPGTGFLAETCAAWEAASTAAGGVGVRVVHLRIGIVLSREGGALAKMLTPFTLGLGGVIGGGRQFMSWIGLTDLVRVIRFALENDELSGPVNTVAPNAVTNREFTKTLGRVLRRPTLVRVPGFAAKLAFGEMADALLLSGARVIPQRLTDSGFAFTHPTLESALRDALGMA